MRSSRWRGMAAVAGLAALVSLSGCQVLIPWWTEYALASPDGRAVAQVQRIDGFPDSEVRVRVKRGARARQLIWREDCGIRFAHAVWEGSRVAVFVDGSVCGAMEVAYDIDADQPVEFSAMKRVLGESMISTYGVTARELEPFGGDIFGWAYSMHPNSERSRSYLAHRKWVKGK